MKKPKLVLLFLILSLSVGGAFVSAGANSDNSANKTYSSPPHTLDEGQYHLTFNEDNLSFTVYDDVNDRTYYSGRRVEDDGVNTSTWKAFLTDGLTVGYFSDNRLIQRSYTLLGGESSFMYGENSVTMAINLKDIQVSLVMKLTLDNKGVIAIEIPGEEIKENNPDLAVLTHIIPYPCISSSYDLVPGYIFIPDGMGAKIDLSTATTATRPYSQRVYGDDIGIFGQNGVLRLASGSPVKKIPFPIYGVGYEAEGGALSLVHKGAEYASINAVVKGINRLNYNYAYTQFNYREQYFKYVDKAGNGAMSLMKDRYTYDAELRVKLLSPGVTISNMARMYQNYLLKEGALHKVIEDTASFPLRLQFLIAENKPNIFGNQEKIVTSFKKIEEMANTLTSDHNIPLNLSVRGYQKGGYSNTSYSAFDFAGSGADKAYRRISEIEGVNKLSFALDYALILAKSRGYAEGDIAKTISNQGVYDFDELTYDNDANLKKRVLLNYPKISKKLNLDQKELTKRVNDGVAMDLENFASTLYSSHFGYVASRSKVISDYQTLLSEAKVNVNLSMPFDYLLPYAKAITEVDTNHSGFYIALEEVPFYAMVISGFIPLYSRPLNLEYSRQQILRLIDYHIYPSFLLTEIDAVELFNTDSRYLFSAMIDAWMDRIIETYNFTKDAFNAIRGARVIGREKLSKDVYKTTYDNDVEIIVNYGTSEFTLGNITVPAEGYMVR